MRNFIHLHAATAFSAHFGVSWPEEMAQAAAADGADALAITDRDGLYGAVKHVKACMAAGIDPIIGVDVAVREEVGDVIEVTGRVVVLAHGGASARPGAGYGALCRLISTAHSAPKGPVGLTLTQLAQGVLDPESGRPVLSVLLGPYSPVGKAMESRKYLLPRSKFKQWKEAMPAGSLVAEITSHLNAPGDPLSTTHAVRMVKLAQEFDVPAVLSNAVRYVNQEDGPIADVLDAAKSIASLAALNTLQPTGQAWLKSAAQMGEIARDIVSQGGYGSSSSYGGYESYGSHGGQQGQSGGYQSNQRQVEPGSEGWFSKADVSSHYGNAQQDPSSHYGQGGQQGQGSHSGHHDPDYHQWRSEQLRNLDRDYDDWRNERYGKFAEEFNNWRSQRASQGGSSGSQHGASSNSSSTSSGSGSSSHAHDSSTAGSGTSSGSSGSTGAGSGSSTSGSSSGSKQPK